MTKRQYYTFVFLLLPFVGCHFEGSTDGLQQFAGEFISPVVDLARICRDYHHATQSWPSTAIELEQLLSDQTVRTRNTKLSELRLNENSKDSLETSFNILGYGSKFDGCMKVYSDQVNTGEVAIVLLTTPAKGKGVDNNKIERIIVQVRIDTLYEVEVSLTSE